MPLDIIYYSLTAAEELGIRAKWCLDLHFDPHVTSRPRSSNYHIDPETPNILVSVPTRQCGICGQPRLASAGFMPCNITLLGAVKFASRPSYRFGGPRPRA